MIMLLSFMIKMDIIQECIQIKKRLEINMTFKEFYISDKNGKK